MRRDPQKCSTLATGLEDQMEMPVLQIPYAAVNEARRTARRPTPKIIAFDKCRPEPPESRIPRNAGAGDPTANDQQVKW